MYIFWCLLHIVYNFFADFQFIELPATYTVPLLESLHQTNTSHWVSISTVLWSELCDNWASFAFRFCEHCLTNTDNEQKFDICHSSQEVLSFNQVPINYTYSVYCIHVCDTDSFTSNTHLFALIVYLETVTRKLHGMYVLYPSAR